MSCDRRGDWTTSRPESHAEKIFKECWRSAGCAAGIRERGSCNAISAILIIVECHITYFAGVVSDDFRDFPEASISQNIISMFLREKFDTMIEYLLKILLFLNCEIKSS